MAETPRHQTRSVILSYDEVRYSLLPLDTLLRLHGIDPEQPYTQEDHPVGAYHHYRQTLPASEPCHERD